MTAIHNQHGVALPEPGITSARDRKCGHSAFSPGFSLIELLVVLAVALVVSAIAIPTLTTTMDGVRLRGALGSASNIAQRSRTQAIKRNTYQRLHFATCANQVVLFVTDGTDAAACPAAAVTPVASQVWFSNNFSIPGAPAGGGAPPALTSLIMWGVGGLVPHVNTPLYFSSRGLPCWVNGTACTSDGQGFVYYYRYQNAGHTRWAATSVSPAGRIQSWIWNGTTWDN
jgi:prepilin-type N-terminal cleavage/methylation domain-containing protein